MHLFFISFSTLFYIFFLRFPTFCIRILYNFLKIFSAQCLHFFFDRSRLGYLPSFLFALIPKSTFFILQTSWKRRLPSTFILTLWSGWRFSRTQKLASCASLSSDCVLFSSRLVTTSAGKVGSFFAQSVLSRFYLFRPFLRYEFMFFFLFFQHRQKLTMFKKKSKKPFIVICALHLIEHLHFLCKNLVCKW